MNPREIKLNKRTGSWSVVPYQTTHNTGGTNHRRQPTNSVVNKYGQSWDVSNLFVTGSGLFPQNAGYNPTGTLAGPWPTCPSARYVRSTSRRPAPWCSLTAMIRRFKTLGVVASAIGAGVLGLAGLALSQGRMTASAPEAPHADPNGNPAHPGLHAQRRPGATAGSIW